MARKRVTYRPSKAGSVFGGVAGIIFVGIGLFVVIPTFGPFGVLWTLLAAGITAASFYQAFGKKYTGPEIHIEDEECGKPEDVQQRPSAVRYSRLTWNSPLKISLLPTIFVSVTVGHTWLVRSSAAPSRPGDRSICSE